MRSLESSACAAADKQRGGAAGEGVEGGRRRNKPRQPDLLIFAHFKMKRGERVLPFPECRVEEKIK